jgi:hypothetical protein
MRDRGIEMKPAETARGGRRALRGACPRGFAVIALSVLVCGTGVFGQEPPLATDKEGEKESPELVRGLPVEMHETYRKRLRETAEAFWARPFTEFGLEPREPPPGQIEQMMAMIDRQARQRGCLPDPPLRDGMVLGIPAPLAREEMDLYAEILVLSEAQRERLDHLYERYLAEDWTFRLKKIQPLWDRSFEVVAHEGPHPTIASAQEKIELFEDVDRILAPLLSVERRMFDELAPILAEEQLPLLERVHNLRRRRLYDEAHSMYPGAMLDLTLILHEIEQRCSEPITPTDPDTFHALLTEYDGTLTTFARQRYEADRRALRKLIRITGESQELQYTAEDIEAVRPRLRELSEERLDLIKPEVEAAKRIYDLNRRFAELLAAQLPDDVGRELRRRFGEATYKPIYPNPYDIEEGLNDLLTIEDLSDEQRESLTALRQGYLERRRQLDRRMIDRYMQWKDETARLHGYNGDELDLYRRDMQELQAQRFATARMHLRSARGILTEAQLAALGSRFPTVVEERIEISEEEMAALKQRFRGEPERLEAHLWRRQMERGGSKWPAPGD